MDETQGPAQALPLDHKARFEYLFDSFVSNFSAYQTNVLATAGYLLVAIGWTLGSDETRRFLSNTASVRSISAVAIVVILIIHSMISVVYQRRSQDKYILIAKYTSIDPLPITDYKIPVWLLVINIVLNTLLSTVLLVILLA